MNSKVVASTEEAVVVQSWCPECDWTLYRRFALNGNVKGSMSWQDGDGTTVLWCPRCDVELPLTEMK